MLEVLRHTGNRLDHLHINGSAGTGIHISLHTCCTAFHTFGHFAFLGLCREHVEEDRHGHRSEALQCGLQVRVHHVGNRIDKGAVFRFLSAIRTKHRHGVLIGTHSLDEGKGHFLRGRLHARWVISVTSGEEGRQLCTQIIARIGVDFNVATIGNVAGLRFSQTFHQRQDRCIKGGAISKGDLQFFHEHGQAFGIEGVLAAEHGGAEVRFQLICELLVGLIAFMVEEALHGIQCIANAIRDRGRIRGNRGHIGRRNGEALHRETEFVHHRAHFLHGTTETHLALREVVDRARDFNAMTLQAHEGGEDTATGVRRGALVENFVQLTGQFAIAILAIVDGATFVGDKGLEGGFKIVLAAIHGGGHHLQDMRALFLRQVRGITEVNHRQTFAIGHDVTGVQVAMVETIAVECFLHPLFGELQEVVLTHLGIIVEVNQLCLGDTEATRILEVGVIGRIYATHNLTSLFTGVGHEAVIGFTRCLLQDQRIHGRRHRRVHFHRVELVHRHHALRRTHHAIGVNHHRLFVDVTSVVDVRLFLGEVKFFKDTRILTFEGLLHARRCLCGFDKTATFVLNDRLHVRTQQLDHAFLAIGMFIRNHLAEEGLTHRGGTQRTHHFNRLNRTARTFHDVQQVRLHNAFGNRLKIRLHILQRIAHIFTEGIHGKRLKHLLEQGTCPLKERAHHLTRRGVGIGIAEQGGQHLTAFLRRGLCEVTREHFVHELTITARGVCQRTTDQTVKGELPDGRFGALFHLAGLFGHIGAQLLVNRLLNLRHCRLHQAVHGLVQTCNLRNHAENCTRELIGGGLPRHDGALQGLVALNLCGKRRGTFAFWKVRNLQHHREGSLEDLLHRGLLEGIGAFDLRHTLGHLCKTFGQHRAHGFGKPCERLGGIHHNLNKGIEILLEQIHNAQPTLALALGLVIGDDVGIHDQVCEEITRLFLGGGKTYLGVKTHHRTRSRTFGHNDLAVQFLNARTHHRRMEVTNFFTREDVITRIGGEHGIGHGLIHGTGFGRVVTLQRIGGDRTQHRRWHRCEGRRRDFEAVGHDTQADFTGVRGAPLHVGQIFRGEFGQHTQDGRRAKTVHVRDHIRLKDIHKASGCLRTCHLGAIHGNLKRAIDGLVQLHGLFIKGKGCLLDATILGEGAQGLDHAHHVLTRNRRRGRQLVTGEERNGICSAARLNGGQGVHQLIGAIETEERLEVRVVDFLHILVQDAVEEGGQIIEFVIAQTGQRHQLLEVIGRHRGDIVTTILDELRHGRDVIGIEAPRRVCKGLRIIQVFKVRRRSHQLCGLVNRLQEVHRHIERQFAMLQCIVHANIIAPAIIHRLEDHGDVRSRTLHAATQREEFARIQRLQELHCFVRHAIAAKATEEVLQMQIGETVFGYFREQRGHGPTQTCFTGTIGGCFSDNLFQHAIQRPTFVRHSRILHLCSGPCFSASKDPHHFHCGNLIGR